jgi:hypothetical protein
VQFVSSPEWYEESLARQRDMNSQTWATLRQHGVGRDSELRLEFFYTTVSLEILNEWTDWMVLGGAEIGGCEFDGWGAEISTADD